MHYSRTQAANWRRPIKFRHITSNSDPGPTAWRLLQVEIHGLTVTLHFITTTTIKKAKQRGNLHSTTNSSLQTLKLQPHASPHLGTDLRIAQLSNIGSFDHHLSTTGCASRQTPEPKIEFYRTHRYLREYSGNTHARMLTTLEPMLDLIAPENTNAYASRLPRWSLGDETLAARGNTRTNGDSKISKIHDPRCLSASGASGFSANWRCISLYRKYCRPRSHRLEVAASGDPRSNGDFKICVRDAFPLRELQVFQKTGDG
ncbi:hypothetical protein HZH68_005947 [Vespula germanica]|uniref:Uncharacterized protein n=1 Tax=Vespula germanica TaxID=30212 RepID=A0A834NGH2_VESGE|nr:hypothetical protein HZH68_005947 [Vespula germanica]